MARNVFHAVESNAIPRFIYNASTTTPDTPTGAPVIDALHALAREALQVKSATTVIRPSLFLENLLAPWILPNFAEQGVISTALPVDQRIAWLSQRELGRMVVAAIESDRIISEIIDVGGPAAMDGPTLANAIGAGLGRTIAFESIAASELAARAEPYLGLAAAQEIALHYRHFSDRNSPLRRLHTESARAAFQPFEPESVEQWAVRVLARSVSTG